MPPAPTVAAPPMHATLEEWSKAYNDRLVIVTRLGVELRETGIRTPTRVASFENEARAAAAVRNERIPWRELREPRALTTNVEAAGNGLDGCTFYR